jgi:hypothetical protein
VVLLAENCTIFQRSVMIDPKYPAATMIICKCSNFLLPQRSNTGLFNIQAECGFSSQRRQSD